METQTAFVRTDGAVELHTVTRVDVHLAFVVYPRHAECYHALRLHHAFYQFDTLKFRVFVVFFLYGKQHFLHCLQIFRLAGMSELDTAQYFFDIHNVCFLGWVLRLCLYVNTHRKYSFNLFPFQMKNSIFHDNLFTNVNYA